MLSQEEVLRLYVVYNIYLRIIHYNTKDHIRYRNLEKVDIEYLADDVINMTK